MRQEPVELEMSSTAAQRRARRQRAGLPTDVGDAAPAETRDLSIDVIDEAFATLAENLQRLDGMETGKQQAATDGTSQAADGPADPPAQDTALPLGEIADQLEALDLQCAQLSDLLRSATSSLQ